VNRTEQREYMRKWRIENRKHIRDYNRNYYHKISKNKSEYQKQKCEERRDIIRIRFGNRCGICNTDSNLILHEADGCSHISIWNMKHDDFVRFIDSHNLILLCKHCHSLINQLRKLSNEENEKIFYLVKSLKGESNI